MKTFEQLESENAQLRAQLSTAQKQIKLLQAECSKNNEAACLFDRDTAVEELKVAQEAIAFLRVKVICEDADKLYGACRAAARPISPAEARERATKLLDEQMQALATSMAGKEKG